VNGYAKGARARERERERERERREEEEQKECHYSKITRATSRIVAYAL